MHHGYFRASESYDEGLREDPFWKDYSPPCAEEGPLGNGHVRRFWARSGNAKSLRMRVHPSAPRLRSVWAQAPTTLEI